MTWPNSTEGPYKWVMMTVMEPVFSTPDHEVVSEDE